MMKKIIISTDRDKKIAEINKLNNVVIILFKKDKDILDLIKYEDYIFCEDMKSAVLYLNFQTKMESKSVVIFDCMRYESNNNTVYNRIAGLTDNKKNITVFSDFPFVFDHRNLFTLLRFIDVKTPHYKQWYDDSFIESNGLLSNSIENVFTQYEEYFFVDKEHINYNIHNWNATNEELKLYEEKKHRVIYEKNYSKIKVITSLSGFINRLNSKFVSMYNMLNTETKYTIITNWDKCMTFLNTNNPDKKNIVPTSYHIKQQSTTGEIVFFETIISQKIKFYDVLKCYINNTLHFFVNNEIGVDKLNNDKTVKILESLNEFYEKDWKSI